jgi:hypothetical protein
LLPDAITFPEEFDLAFNHPARRCVPVWLKLHRMPEVHGDKLVSSQFVNSITRGFAAVGEPNVAVCLLPEEVVDQGVITSRNPGDLEAFSAEIIGSRKAATPSAARRNGVAEREPRVII